MNTSTFKEQGVPRLCPEHIPCLGTCSGTLQVDMTDDQYKGSSSETTYKWNIKHTLKEIPNGL